MEIEEDIIHFDISGGTYILNLNSSILAEHNSVYKQNFVTYPKIYLYQITVNSKLDKLDYFKVVDKVTVASFRTLLKHHFSNIA